MIGFFGRLQPSASRTRGDRRSKHPMGVDQRSCTRKRICTRLEHSCEICGKRPPPEEKILLWKSASRRSTEWHSCRPGVAGQGSSPSVSYRNEPQIIGLRRTDTRSSASDLGIGTSRASFEFRWQISMRNAWSWWLLPGFGRTGMAIEPSRLVKTASPPHDVPASRYPACL